MYLSTTDSNGAPNSYIFIGSRFFAGSNVFHDEQPTFNFTYQLAANTTYAITMQGSAGGTIGWKYGANSPGATGTAPTTWLNGVTQPANKNWLTNNDGTNWISGAPANGGAGYSMIINASANGSAAVGSGGAGGNGGVGGRGGTPAGPGGVGGIGGAGGRGGTGGVGGNGNGGNGGSGGSGSSGGLGGKGGSGGSARAGNAGSGSPGSGGSAGSAGSGGSSASGTPGGSGGAGGSGGSGGQGGSGGTP